MVDGWGGAGVTRIEYRACSHTYDLQRQQLWAKDQIIQEIRYAERVLEPGSWDPDDGRRQIFSVVPAGGM